MYFITLIIMMMITEGCKVRCRGSVSLCLVYYWCTSTGHWAGAGAGAEEVTQHSAVDTKATATPHQTRVWPAIYQLFIANLYLDIPLFYLRYAHLIMPTF